MIKNDDIDTYLLMHKNVEVLKFKYIDGRVIDYQIMNNEHLPLDLELALNFTNEINENDNTKKIAIVKWLNRRLIPIEREGYQHLVEHISAEEDEERRKIVIDNNALSLSDCYWIKKIDSDEKWESVNFYKNDFGNELAEIFLESAKTVKGKLKLTKTPTLMLDGQMPKAWIIDKNGNRVLLKRSISTKKNVVNEIIVSKLLDLLEIEHIEYYYKNYKDKLCCACECICNEDTELVSANDFTIEHNTNSIIETINYFINKCEKVGIKDISEKVNEMLTIDYLIGNTDRHWKNFAVLRDTNTLQYIKFAPIYDNDRAFDYSSDNNYMVGTMTVDKIKNIVKENKITKWTYEEFAEKIKPILEIDTKDQHNINDIYNIICKKYYLLIQKISY